MDCTIDQHSLYQYTGGSVVKCIIMIMSYITLQNASRTTSNSDAERGLSLDNPDNQVSNCMCPTHTTISLRHNLQQKLNWKTDRITHRFHIGLFINLGGGRT